MTTNPPEPTDALWADFTAQPSDGEGGNAEGASLALPQQGTQSKAVAVALATTIGGAVLFFLLQRLLAECGRSSLALAAVALLLGALQGFFLARGAIAGRLVSSGLSLLWILGGTGWQASRLAWPESALTIVFPILCASALIPGFVVFLFFVLFPPREISTSGESKPVRRSPFAKTGAVEVIYDPVPDPMEALLETRLLELCNQDRNVFGRLLAHEQSQHPQLVRTEQLRLAIDHFERDRQ